MRLAKLMGGAGLLVATALVGGTLIGSALAAPSGSATTPTLADGHGIFLGGANGEYCDVYLDTLASELGVSRDDLLPASQAAAIAAIDAAVANGDLDEDRATNMKERIEAIDEAGCGLAAAFGRGFAAGHARGLVHGDVMEAVATALGIDSSELIDLLADADTIQEVVESQGGDYDQVKASVLSAVQSDLDAAVEEGLDQDRADAALERIQTWLDGGGELGMRGFGGPGHGHRGGPRF